MVIKFAQTEFRISKADFVYKIVLLSILISLSAVSAVASLYSYVSVRAHDVVLFHAPL